MTRHLFSAQQANRTLPLVRRIVADILECGARIRTIAEGPRDEVALGQVRHLRYRLQDLIDELETIGCSYRDWNFEAGLVDFPGEIEGQEVCLCWKSDEETVGWYHTPEGGFAGRRAIPEDLLG